MHPVRLIVVEDMPMEAEIAVRHLESGGFTCSWKRVDTESALRATLAETLPDIILSDFTLPGFDGISALEISCEVAPDTLAQSPASLPKRWTAPACARAVELS